MYSGGRFVVTRRFPAETTPDARGEKIMFPKRPVTSTGGKGLEGVTVRVTRKSVPVGGAEVVGAGGGLMIEGCARQWRSG